MCGYPRKLNVPPVAECDAVFNGVLNRKVAERIWATYFYHQIIWVHVIVIGSFHLAAIYGAYLMLTSAQIYTLVFSKKKHSILSLISTSCMQFHFCFICSIHTLYNIGAWNYGRRSSSLVTSGI